ncbi:MAG: TIGR02444 family protein [Gammaproteobacteria bacterium]|nr:TIGR02444 family protein [Gammaproteobacteria bacterium]
MTAHESFWNFSNRVYRKPHVSSTCLTLQSSYGLDVNLLLFSCWHAHTRGLFDAQMLRDALAFSSMWADNVVRPLRSARTWMKTNTESAQSDSEVAEGFSQLREQIKTLELQCEQFQENMLESLVKTPVQMLSTEMTIAAAVYNLRYIIEASTLPLSSALTDSLAGLVLNVLDQADDEEIRHAIRKEFIQAMA